MEGSSLINNATKTTKTTSYVLYALVFFIVVALVIVVILIPILLTSTPAMNVEVKALKEAALNSTVCYERLAYVCDTFGPRFSGSSNLESAIDWIVEKMKEDNLDNVRTENISIIHWVRGVESLVMLHPYQKQIGVLGLGPSIGTGPNGIEADVIVVSDWNDLQNKAQMVPGKIVVFNARFGTYGTSRVYRSDGPIRASKYGAVACLVRSVTGYSLQTLHTGGTSYDPSVSDPIPAAAITVEDAEFLQRLQDSGIKPRLHLRMEPVTYANTISRNIIAEIEGEEEPNKHVVIGGHIDSWDVGTGALDDAGGCFISWEAIRLMRALDMRPRRTIRVVMWTNEELGARGADQYALDHRSEILNSTIAAIESDSGIFFPTHFGYFSSDSNNSRSKKAYQFARNLVHDYLKDILEKGDLLMDGSGRDIRPIVDLGVPGFSLENAEISEEPYKYFNYHHTDADTIDKVDSLALKKCVAAMGVMSWVLANSEEVISNNKIIPEKN